MNQARVRIGIIGSGFGGASSAHFLRKAFGPKIELIVYEADKHIGGRTIRENVNKKPCEMGGSVFHANNRYIFNFVEQLGLNAVDLATQNTKLGLYGGHERGVVLSTADSWKIFERLKLLWHFGLDITKLSSYTDNMIRKFDKIYELQAKGVGFTSTCKLLDYLDSDFVRMSMSSHENWLRNELGLNDRVVDDLVHGLIANNYTQGLGVHAFVGFVAASTLNSKLFAIKQGNEAIPQKLLTQALADNAHEEHRSVVHSQVNSITKLDDDSFLLRGTEGIEHQQDYVIIAAPLHQESELKAPAGVDLPIVNYREMFSTAVAGKARGDFFQMRQRDVPSNLAMLVTKSGYRDPTCLIRSLVPKLAEPGEEAVVSVFSDCRRTADPLVELPEKVFHKETVQDIKAKRWLAYPIYRPVDNPEQDLGQFVLAPKLYYANAIELAASCMEMAIIGGRNCANLIKQRLKEDGKKAASN